MRRSKLPICYVPILSLYLVWQEYLQLDYCVVSTFCFCIVFLQVAFLLPRREKHQDSYLMKWLSKNVSLSHGMDPFEVQKKTQTIQELNIVQKYQRWIIALCRHFLGTWFILCMCLIWVLLVLSQKWQIFNSLTQMSMHNTLHTNALF